MKKILFSAVVICFCFGIYCSCGSCDNGIREVGSDDSICIDSVVSSAPIAGNDIDSINSAVRTKYSYTSDEGTKHPIYMNDNGDCFVIRIDKDGKKYRQFLPEVTNALKQEIHENGQE